MPASYNDMAVLASNAVFQDRVRSAMIAGAILVKGESPTAIPFHREREAYVVQALNSPDTFKVLFANAVATDSTVIADATQGGTVALTTGNVATQQALVTDAHILAALSATFNSFFRTPAV